MWSARRRITPVAALSPAPSGGTYQGPIDVCGAAFGAWGFRAMSAAYITGAKHLVDLVDQAGANLVTIDCLPTGAFDAATYNAWVTAHSVTTPLVTKLYDQAGTNHLTQGTAANMPIFNGASGVISMTVQNSFGGLYVNTGNITLSQPFTLSSIVNVTVLLTANAPYAIDGGTGNGVAASNSGGVPQFGIAGGSGVSTTTGTYGTPSAVQYLVAGSSPASKVCVDGGTSSIGSGVFSFPATPLYVYVGTSSAPIKVTEIVLWSGDKSGNFSALNTNQHTTWGF